MGQIRLTTPDHNLIVGKLGVKRHDGESVKVERESGKLSLSFYPKSCKKNGLFLESNGCVQ
jgi:hypothetical protein